VCQAPACDDLVKNGNETDKDCGGGTCPACAIGLGCSAGSDCQTGICVSSLCKAPAVSATSPADGDGQALRSSTIAVTFNGSMDPSTLTGQTSAGACTGSIQVSSDNFATCIAFTTAAAAMTSSNTVATLTPASLLSYGTTYKVRVMTAAKSANGTALAAQYTMATGFTVPASCVSSPLVISQIYGGGGNASAPYRKDFIELHNRGTVAINLATYSVQYESQGGSTWSTTSLSGTIQPGAYYLIEEGSNGGTVGALLTNPNATGSIDMSATQGHVALVSSTTALSGACPSGGVVDLVAFGSTTTVCREGTANAPAPSNTNAILRAASACTDNNQNSTDFATGTPAPRNSSTTPLICACAL
jgi:hypothetical protein